MPANSTGGGVTTLASGAVLLALLAGLIAACSPPPDPVPLSEDDVTLAVKSVERVFVSRAFGGSLPLVLLDLEFEPAAPSSVAFQALGSDGATYRGARPVGAKVCGIPGYLGEGADAGHDRMRRTVGFVVPNTVRLTELRWRQGPNADERVAPLQGETLVCRP